MTGDELEKYIRKKCRLIIYKNKKEIGDSRGTFEYTTTPVISIAIKGIGRLKVNELLLHEWGHYLQWECGFIQMLDYICPAYTFQEQWFEGKIELSPMGLQVLRNTLLTLEYDAELRGFEWGVANNVEFNRPRYLKCAAAYMDMIKWEMKNRKGMKGLPDYKYYDGKKLTQGKLYGGLSRDL